jgi:hypothetical protein
MRNAAMQHQTLAFLSELLHMPLHRRSGRGFPGFLLDRDWLRLFPLLLGKAV